MLRSEILTSRTSPFIKTLVTIYTDVHMPPSTPVLNFTSYKRGVTPAEAGVENEYTLEPTVPYSDVQQDIWLP